MPDWLPRFHSPAIRRAAKRIHQVLGQVIRSCREGLAGGEASMIRLLLEASDPETGQPLDDSALRNEAAVIFMAGHETTANSLAWTWYLLSQNPDSEECGENTAVRSIPLMGKCPHQHDIGSTQTR